MTNVNYDAVPVARMRDAVERYLEKGIEPGSFLRAVISNDLAGAVGSADVGNAAHLKEWVQFFYWEVPSKAWGSSEAYDAWRYAGGFSQYDKKEASVT